MSAVTRTIFGGSTSKQDSRPVDTTPDELKKLREPFVSGLTDVIQGGGAPAYGGQLTAGLTEPERGGLIGTEQAAFDPTRKNLLNYTQAGGFLPGQGGSNPFLEAAIKAAQRPTMQGLEEVLGRTLPGRFTAGGNFTQPQGSSAFDRAAAIATRGAADASGDIATKISSGAYESERGRQQQSIALGQGEVDTMIKNLQAQALPRLIEQYGLDQALKLFQDRTSSLMQALQIAAGSPIAQQGQVSSGKSDTQTGIIPGLKWAFPTGL